MAGDSSASVPSLYDEDLCKTKPIWRWPAGIRGQIVQNEPNLQEPTAVRGWADCAKRSQFQAVPGGSGPGERGPWRAIVQNRAILTPVSGNGRAPAGMGPCRGRLRKTKPIWPSLTESRDSWGQRCETNPIQCPSTPGRTGPQERGIGANVQNEPNLAQLGRRQVPGERKMQNEANFGRSLKSEASSVKQGNPRLLVFQGRVRYARWGSGYRNLMGFLL